jgi:hypothetical protein
MSLRVNADCDDNSKHNRCFYDVDPQCSLSESQNNIRFRHDFTQSSNRTVQIPYLNMGIAICYYNRRLRPEFLSEMRAI